MADFAPETLNAIIQGDRLSAERLGGHGNAIAQVYNHIIMPLAHDRDKKTQVVWGVKVFEYFFRTQAGRHASGGDCCERGNARGARRRRHQVHSPGTARQAKRWRKMGDSNWQQDGGVDLSQAYQVNLPSGRKIAVFFYDASSLRRSLSRSCWSRARSSAVA